MFSPHFHTAANTKAKKWDLCLDIAGAIIKLDQERPDAWIHRSFAIHELKKTQMAYDQLLPVADKFPKVWLIPYNLACYCAQTGRLEECKRWFKKAIIINERNVQRAAIDDPDFKPLWDSMSGTFWGGRNNGLGRPIFGAVLDGYCGDLKQWPPHTCRSGLIFFAFWA